jgi:hypothetical protein
VPPHPPGWKEFPARKEDEARIATEYLLLFVRIAHNVLHFGSACRSADLDEAIEIASKHPMARYGLVEIRPFWPFE